MGYYTLFRIRIINKYNTKENLEELKGYIEKISGYTFDISGSVIYSNEIKWYSSKYHMKLVSQFFPEYEIQLKGKGEEGEVWEVIFKDGEYNINDNPIFYDDESESDNDEEIYIEINKQKYKE